MHKSYLIGSEAGKRLYAAVADMPIIDYHCHLSPKEIYEDAVFDNIGQIWLAYDHYKWRLMRSFGVDERYITGNAPWRDKFQKYAETIALAAGNALYHWTAMELDLYFGIDTPLNGDTAEDIWQRANAVIAKKQLSPRKMIALAKVEYIATTDDIADDPAYHGKLRSDASFPAAVTPSFRTDNLLLIRREGYVEYIKKLSGISDIDISDLSSLKEAVCRRLDVFCDNGCMFTDIGIEHFPPSIGTEEQADAAFAKALQNVHITDSEYDGFLGYMYLFLAGEYRKRNLVMQWHLAVKRNANTALFENAGADCGGDCMGDAVPTAHIIAMLDAVNTVCLGDMPKTILYALNPAMCPALAAAAASFPNVLCGAAWWFCDNKRGIIDQIQTVAESGHIGAFLGMLTDSRSFLSYARHDFFRRIFCGIVGEWVDRGEFADDENAVRLARRVCYDNIKAIIDRKG